MPKPAQALPKHLILYKDMILFSWASPTGGEMCLCLCILLWSNLILREKLLFPFARMKEAA